MSIRTRIAPSPTGFVHIGTIYNALFAHALAKHNSGDFILRIEDTDRTRFVEGATEELYEMLEVFGLAPDEGPIQGGEFGPYIQSEKMKSGIYLKKAEELIEKGYAYYCFLTKEELQEIRDSQGKEKKALRSKYRNLPKKEALARIENGEKYVIRLKVPENETITVNDAILGGISWNTNEVDDQVLIKSDGFPTYHLAVVVDDSDMKISHITRGFEWLASTPKQVLLYKYLDLEQPIFAHSPLILDPSGGKLSKRKGNVSAKQFLAEGYLVPAILNFLMLMGWSAPIERLHGEKEREIFSHKEFIELFDLKDRNKSSAVFNREKLIWFNQQYIMMMQKEELADVFLSWLEKYGSEFKYEFKIDDFKKLVEEKGKAYLQEVLVLEQTRIKLLSEVPASILSFYIDPTNFDYKEVKQLKKIEPEQYKSVLTKFLDQITDIGKDTNKWDHEIWENTIRSIAGEVGIKDGQAFMSLRFAITGTPFSPPLFEMMQVLGYDTVVRRIQNNLK